MNKKLYVGNLSSETSDAQLEELFGKAGKVESVRVMRDTDTGRGAVLADVVGGEWKTISRTRLEPAPCFTGPITAGQKCHNFRRAEAGPKSGGSHESQGRCPQC